MDKGTMIQKPYMDKICSRSSHRQSEYSFQGDRDASQSTVDYTIPVRKKEFLPALSSIGIPTIFEPPLEYATLPSGDMNPSYVKHSGRDVLDGYRIALRREFRTRPFLTGGRRKLNKDLCELETAKIFRDEKAERKMEECFSSSMSLSGSKSSNLRNSSPLSTAATKTQSVPTRLVEARPRRPYSRMSLFESILDGDSSVSSRPPSDLNSMVFGERSLSRHASRELASSESSHNVSGIGAVPANVRYAYPQFVDTPFW